VVLSASKGRCSHCMHGRYCCHQLAMGISDLYPGSNSPPRAARPPQIYLELAAQVRCDFNCRACSGRQLGQGTHGKDSYASVTRPSSLSGAAIWLHPKLTADHMTEVDLHLVGVRSCGLLLFFTSPHRNSSCWPYIASVCPTNAASHGRWEPVKDPFSSSRSIGTYWHIAGRR
jgi:hypothetical protein